MVSSETLYAQLRDAVFDNDKARLQELLQRDGVDVDHFDAGGQTLLHLACFWGRMELVKVLLNAGASLKVKNAAACTALDLATHWGHSAVAEVIRLRGGRSVWEEKFGHLQVQVEDLKLQAQQSQIQYLDKKRDFDTLTVDYHSVHTQFEEAKSAHALSEHALSQVRLEVQTLASDVTRLQCALDGMTANYHAALIEKARAEHLQHEAQRETAAVLAHRDEVLLVMQESVAKQEDAAYNWQRAEVAAAVAESQRNFAFAERDQFQKKHVAALAELMVVAAKLDAAEEELMTLKTDLAEHIYEQKREQTIKKRAARMLSHMYGGGAAAADSAGTGGGSINPSLPLKSGARRSLTTPTDKPSQAARVLSPPMHHQAELRATTATVPAATLIDVSSEGSSSSSSSKKTKTKYFSLAAREYGERLRAEEIRKHKERVKRHARMENQYLTQGLNAPVRAAEQFQDEFVAAVQSFATARSAKWKELKKDRDRQAWFTRSVLARPVTTPHSLGAVAGLGNGDSSDNSDAGIDHAGADPSSSTSSDDKKSNNTVRFGIYHKYARPACLDNPLRPVTSPLEVRMQNSFFAVPTAAAATMGVDKSVEHQLSAQRGADRSSERQQRTEQPEDASAHATAFLPAVR